MSNRGVWGKDKVKIIKELKKLIMGRIYLEDIFRTSNYTEIARLQRLPYQPNSNQPLRANLNPIKSPFHYSDSSSQQVRPLTRGKFYLTHSLHWSFWNSMQDFKYSGALDIIYILSKEEMKNYRHAHPLITPREEPEEEIIAMKWPAYWLGEPQELGRRFAYPSNPSLQICSHIHFATGSTQTSALNESEFTKNFKQLIPIGVTEIVALNYPNL
jgi:hypothetical protein